MNKDFKLSKNQIKVLKFINNNPGMIQRDIFLALKDNQISKGTLCIILQKAELKGLIVKYGENRKKRIHPTKECKDLINSIERI
ncbi:MAG: hypothetical protein ACRCZO_14360 [Cetobacterium sp.]|uniref:hypothetical protein n=1 Tax=Cetobacterium sp. TaxID=2071632 RepID=UPI003EE767A9